MSVISLKAELENRFQPNGVGEIALNNLASLIELMTQHEVTGMTIAPRRPDGSYGDGSDETKTWYKMADGRGAPGINLVIDSLTKVLTVLSDDRVMQDKVRTVIQAFYYMGLTNILPKAPDTVSLAQTQSSSTSQDTQTQ